MRKTIVMLLCFAGFLNANAQNPSDTLITWSLANDTSPTHIDASLKAKGERFGNKLKNISYANGFQTIAPPNGGWYVNIDTTATAGVYINFPFGLNAIYSLGNGIGYGCTNFFPDKISLSAYTDVANDSIKITPYLYDSSLYVDSSIFCFWDTTNIHSVNYSCGGSPFSVDYYKYINGHWYYYHPNNYFVYDSSVVTNYYQRLYPTNATAKKGTDFYISSNSATNPNNILNYLNYYNSNINNERFLFLRFYISSSNPNANIYLKQVGIGGGFVTLLPINFKSFTALKKNDKVQLNWSLENEINVEKYAVEKATKNKNFETMKVVLSNKGNSYNLIDDTPNKEVNMYRIKAIAKDGKATYSSVMRVLSDNKYETVTIYPNPVKDILLGQVETKKLERAIIQVTDLQGKILQQKEQQLQLGNNAFSINTSALAKGIYILAIKGSVNKSMQFIKE